MLKSTILLSVIAMAMANSIPADGESNISVQVVTPQELDNWLKENPQAQPLVPEISQDSKLVGQTRTVKRYTLGSRQGGDRRVASKSGSNSWATPHNVAIVITYPASGTGAIVTHVSIEVNQSNTSGRAYVRSGGIGYRFISVVVEAQNTKWFNWSCNIYGK